ncbi:CbiQ family ECF transporter T component [Candidatus Riflebacteria bacterium]
MDLIIYLQAIFVFTSIKSSAVLFAIFFALSFLLFIHDRQSFLFKYSVILTFFFFPFLLLLFFQIQKNIITTGFTWALLPGAFIIATTDIIKMLTLFLSVILFFCWKTEKELLHLYRKLFYPLRKLGLPVDDGEVIILVSLKFFPNFKKEFNNLLYYRKLRLISTGKFQSFNTTWTFSLAIPLILKVLRNTQLIAVAMLEKGFLTCTERSFYFERPLNAGQIALYGLFYLTFQLLFFWWFQSG